MPDETPSEVNLELLILRMARKDREALDVFLKFCGGKIKGFLTRRYGDVLKEQEIDQAVSDTAFDAWRFADRYKTAKGTAKSWIIRIACNDALSILRGENRNRAQHLQHDPGYDPAEHCADDPPEVGSKGSWRVQQLEDIINNELRGLEQAVARADLAAGGPADTGRLATIHGTSPNTIFATRSKVRAKIRRLIEEREAQRGKS